MPTYSHDPRCECPECCRAARAENERLRAALTGCEYTLIRVADQLRKENNTAYARFCDGGAKLARETLEVAK